MANDNETPAVPDPGEEIREAVLSLQETASDEEDVQAHSDAGTSTYSVTLCTGSGSGTATS